MPFRSESRERKEAPQRWERCKDAKTKALHCTYCGTKQEKTKCPAFGKECSVCHKPNHFAYVCKTKQIGSNVHSLADDNETAMDYEEILTP